MYLEFSRVIVLIYTKIFSLGVVLIIFYLFSASLFL